MSSEEDFSLVTEPSMQSLERVKASITNYKKRHEQLLQEQKELATCRDETRELAREFRLRTEKLSQALQKDELSHKDAIGQEKAKLNLLMEEELDLLREIEKVEKALKEEDAHNSCLKEQTDVFTAVPERKFFFKGATEKAVKAETFEMEPRVEYPMEGGTALVTFEEEVVAKKILEMKSHQVNLGESECSITVEARPVQLMVPRLVEIDTEVCPRRILISDLPRMDTENLLNKLEIHFSKRKHGGGEVDECEMMPDSWTVVLTFVDNDIAKRLTDIEYHDVKLQNKKQRVRVTPFLNGNITNLQTKMSVCPRTVLLTRIPVVTDRDTLQDLLEIHFQQTKNGGGEIEAFLYNPLDEQTTALFQGVSQNKDE
ncbi:Interferon-induced 35 kDa protein [Collichthys lucidus]|uniref:Interferon-induced 35 kDa protein n=1 Tax=Collichthys lucidus TaxID=240159 RepID=A0A4U5VS03_COLLU|nr:Interferon-induced 35 kDa protein [Collichthys lucidus]